MVSYRDAAAKALRFQQLARSSKRLENRLSQRHVHQYRRSTSTSGVSHHTFGERAARHQLAPTTRPPWYNSPHLQHREASSIPSSRPIQKSRSASSPKPPPTFTPILRPVDPNEELNESQQPLPSSPPSQCPTEQDPNEENDPNQPDPSTSPIFIYHKSKYYLPQTRYIQQPAEPPSYSNLYYSFYSGHPDSHFRDLIAYHTEVKRLTRLHEARRNTSAQALAKSLPPPPTPPDEVIGTAWSAPFTPRTRRVLQSLWVVLILFSLVAFVMVLLPEIKESEERKRKRLEDERKMRVFWERMKGALGGARNQGVVTGNVGGEVDGDGIVDVSGGEGEKYREIMGSTGATNAVEQVGPVVERLEDAIADDGDTSRSPGHVDDSAGKDWDSTKVQDERLLSEDRTEGVVVPSQSKNGSWIPSIFKFW